MDREEKKGAVEMLLATARDDLDIKPVEFMELAQELIEQWNQEDRLELYRKISPGMYRRVRN